MHKRLVLMAAALLFSCSGGGAQTDVVEPLAAGLRQCAEPVSADRLGGNCYFIADGRMADAGLPSGFIFVATDGAKYHIFNELPLDFYVDGLRVHVEATLMKDSLTFGVGMPVRINTISK